MANLYALHQTLFSLGGDAWIEDEHGNRLFEVDGKAFALGRTLDLLDPSGTVLFTVHAPMVSLRPTFEISRDDETVATIHKALFTLLGSRYSIELADGSELEATGDFLDHEFQVRRSDEEVIGASRAWFSLHDTYGVRVADGFDPALALAIVISIEQMESRDSSSLPV
jgi:uncharacterized protein YxjI